MAVSKFMKRSTYEPLQQKNLVPPGPSHPNLPVRLVLECSGPRAPQMQAAQMEGGQGWHHIKDPEALIDYMRGGQAGESHRRSERNQRKDACNFEHAPGSHLVPSSL
eukprot:1146357-Pelagomonas_calceolata.AAC.4